MLHKKAIKFYRASPKIYFGMDQQLPSYSRHYLIIYLLLHFKHMSHDIKSYWGTEKPLRQGIAENVFVFHACSNGPGLDLGNATEII